MKSNILLLSAGRRVELLRFFQRDCAVLSFNSAVFAADMKPNLSAACQTAEKAFEVPRVTCETYISVLEKICLDNDIGLVIPTIDTELLLLSRHRNRFLKNGINIVISDSKFVSQCRDKRKTSELFNQYNISQPAIFDKNHLKFPCFCKPYDGSCSKGALAVMTKNDLTPELLDNPKNMFMELVPSSYHEYTIDAYFTQHGYLCCLVPRKRLETRAGEVSKGVTCKNFVYKYLRQRLSKLEGARGCITIQVFANDDTQDIKGLEINPRFGGGYPLSDEAKATFTKWLIQEYLLKLNVSFFDDWEDNMLMLRYDAKLISKNYVK